MIGYSMFPMSMVATLVAVMFFIPKFLVVGFTVFGTYLSFKCTLRVVKISVSKKKAMLVVYPLFLFYFALAWLTIAY